MIALVDGRVHGKVEEPSARSNSLYPGRINSDNINNKRNTKCNGWDVSWEMRVQKGLLAESYLIGRPSVLRSKQELQPAMENKNATFVLRHFRI